MQAYPTQINILFFHGISMRYTHTKKPQSPRLLMRSVKTMSIKKDTAFKAKIMLENEDTRKDLNKVRKKQVKQY